MNQDPALLFFDVDGTLTFFDPEGQSDKSLEAQVSPAVKQAFATLRANGHYPLICTGRPLPLISDTLLSLQPAGLVINGGGALLVDGELVVETPIAPETVRELAQRAEAAGTAFMFEGNDKTCEFAPPGKDDPYVPGMPIVHSLAELELDQGRKICKVCGHLSEFEKLDYDGFISSNFTMCETGGGRGEITPKGIDKGYGVQKAAEHFGMQGAKTYGFGDSGNDLGMLRAVDVAVAMGNAMPEVKEAADYITDDVRDDGVVTALEHFGLI